MCWEVPERQEKQEVAGSTGPWLTALAAGGGSSKSDAPTHAALSSSHREASGGGNRGRMTSSRLYGCCSKCFILGREHDIISAAIIPLLALLVCILFLIYHHSLEGIRLVSGHPERDTRRLCFNSVGSDDFYWFSNLPVSALTQRLLLCIGFLMM